MPRPDPQRRRWLARGGAFGLLGALAWCAPLRAAAPAAAAPARFPTRVVSMNWELTETLLALGVVPVGVSLPDWYRSSIVEPPLPPGVADIGLLYQPNFEVLLALRPDLLVITPGHLPALRTLQRVAPTITLSQYMTSAQPYRDLCGETVTLGARLGRTARAQQLVAEAARTTEAVRARLAARPALLRHPLIVAELVDDRHLRVYGRGSLFDEMLARLGAANAAHPRDGGAAWPTQAGYALVPLQRLAEVPAASLLLVGPVRPDARRGLDDNAIWQALPAVRERRVATLPVIAPYGGLVSMQRFAGAIEAALTAIDAGGGGVA
ncbi:iron-siderophore ABC transporter substrate-binding protein [Burkholderia glumae]|uniref:Iron-siderophore ABC transporter substrate-binding protein n=4 Tax=Burkholderia glumae TaxID=337 RepID=A0AAQ0BSM0_BURGL|nr:iron-siderophore ABC transporter substrate-binding protein [Burkholderia glumae]ACR31382.1 Fe3 -hydroxamate ABC transporter periplasmic component [Burkholderia glumae BGR1]AJY64825.1 periplasmic binding family protein [Burkholderia glumae LMG 2196 = ATCC 33617]KHJ61453.1 ABC transporter substrate-binding protein [Burkholderia glumae]MCM2485460.1 iron-siderophore ABC transporter substrate-binding protein [Burkholderia glumae]MCM2511154.1 iron-siderophore ABC transporter substrate-binding pro